MSIGFYKNNPVMMQHLFFRSAMRISDYLTSLFVKYAHKSKTRIAALFENSLTIF
jgi:hypothetical protein